MGAIFICTEISLFPSMYGNFAIAVRKRKGG